MNRTAETSMMITARSASICFVAPNAYPALSGRHDLAHIGGAERQQVLLAAELARRGHQVSFVVRDHGQSDAENIRTIRVFKCYDLREGVRILRFIHPRLTGLWRAMTRADADIYYQRGAGAETAVVGAWCRRHARAFIFAIAHDTDCMWTTPLISRSERLLYHYGLRCADPIIAQTARQKEMLRAAFGYESTLIRSCSPWTVSLASRDVRYTDRILWVGRLSPEKRPEWVIRLARDLPNRRFDLVGQSNPDSTAQQGLVERIRALPNVHWHGYVDHDCMKALYEHASLLVCTSESEGFPNVFLEAWSEGKAVLTTVDPDGVVSTFGLGRVAADYSSMRDHLASLDADRTWWWMAGDRGRAYVERYHRVASAVDALERLMQTCVGLRAASRSRGDHRM